MNFMEWYESLAKPAWTPEPAFIGLMWQIIYPIIAVTFGFVLVQVLRGKVPRRVAVPFVVNLVANLAFTPIQFGLKSLTLASIDIVLVWGSIVWLAAAVWRHYPWVTLAQVPYFAWVSVATVLQLSISWMNR